MSNATRLKTPAHACPGDCGEQVPEPLVACGSCWWLLPVLQRDKIRRASGMDRLSAVGDALIWFRSNVEGGEFVGI